MNHEPTGLVMRLLVVITAACSLMLGGTRAACADTYHVTTEICSGTDSITWAIAQANAHPNGSTPDIISIEVNNIKIGEACNGDRDEVTVRPTESVIIEGDGNHDGVPVKFESTGIFLNQQGNVNTLATNDCPFYQGGEILAAQNTPFMRVGTFGSWAHRVDNTGVNVEINDVKVFHVRYLADVNMNASLTLRRMDAWEINSWGSYCGDSPIKAWEGVDLTIEDSQFSDSINPALSNNGFAQAFIIGPGGAGNLTIRNSHFENLNGMAAVSWVTKTPGKKVYIVSSQFSDAGGLWLEGDGVQLDAYVTNTLFRLGDYDMSTFDKIFAVGNHSGGSTRLEFSGSTIQMIYAGCTPNSNPNSAGPCGSPWNLGLPPDVAEGPIIGAINGSSIALRGTAVGVGYAQSVGEGNLAVFGKAYGGTLTADQYTWAQPTSGQGSNGQSAAAMKAVVVGLQLTDPPGLYAGGYAGTVAGWAPLIGTTGSPGVLLHAIPNATIPPPAGNELLNPIDGTPIVYDALGKQYRVDGAGHRDIGAIQVVETPNLAASPGNAKADLSWNRVNQPPSGAITHYEICYGIGTPPVDPAIGSACPSTQISSPDAGTLNLTVTGLNNGTTYWFIIRSANATIYPGPWSLPTSATPSGVPDTPAIFAIGGDGSVGLSWVPPSDNGSPITGYVVKYRPVTSPESAWTSWAFSGTDTFTTIDSLTNGVTYEFEVAAVNGSPVDIGFGPGQSAFGTTTATPAKILKLAYPTPIDAFEGTLQTINPALANLLGTPTYTRKSGALPSGLNLDGNTGIISGSPAAGSGSVAPGTSYTATIQVSQSGPPVQTRTATLIINVIAIPPRLQLIYPDLLGVPVGSGPYSLVPSTSGFTGTITYSRTDGSLPDGLSLDPNTGVISGTPTTATSGVFTPTIAASAQGGAEFRQNVLEIEVLPLLSYPPANPALNSPFSLTPTVSPTVTPGTFSVASGTLPTGLALDPGTGEIAGTPTDLVSQLVDIQFVTGTGHPQTVTATVLILISGPLNAPNAPDPLTGTGTPGSQESLTWTTPFDNGSPITGYLVSYRPLGGTSWIGWPFSGIGTTTTVTGLTLGINYEFKVAAVNGIGTGPDSQTLAGPYLPCDVNGDRSVNKADIAVINAARNTPASAVGDVRDQNHDGVINLYDSRQCTLLCTKPLCAL